ncbi:MAG: potassium transporter KefB [Acidobacteria bacterium]|nr:MAG: potassium transporter KefB [Acidobacteriota bacterium]REK04053.1 MAG: potassium transporter KefB [Acidobacteriota bacterium]REK15215.1 MAG: potassium transporter KefB [Acidobacteriota bacterium]REK46305.1 MAG: potassium transporter KefB [Acidobacteriota bacterium]
MHTPELFADLLLIFLVSVPVAFLCLRLKLPLLVGLMLTGILIGPYGLGLIHGLEEIEILAEIGVALLLFTIGVEFSISKLKELRRLVILGGGLQVLLTIAVTAGAAVMFGRELRQAVFFGFLIALSSTAIVLKTYVERREMNAPHGKSGIGILLFQDISIVVMMLLVPVLGGTESMSASDVLWSLGGSFLALIAIVAAGWLLIPRFLKFVVNLRSPEVFVLSVILLSLGTAWITSQFGLSLALGAFIAGLVISESEFRHQITADILPFRDVFNSLFFVSIGLLLSIPALIANISTVAILVLSLFAVKALIIWLVIKVLGFPQRVAIMTALGLAQIGEFSFVLAKAGKSAQLLPDSDYQTFLAAAIITMAATPFVIAGAPRVTNLLQNILRDREPDGVDEQEELHLTSSGGLTNHVIIVGYGLNGRNLARVLRAVTVPYTVLELNPRVVQKAKEKGEKINYGDATRRELLNHAHIDEANALVLAMSDPISARRTVRIARQMKPDLYIVVRTRYVSEITELLELGANEVIPEEFETSIEIFSRVLQRYGVARQVIEQQIETIRKQGYEMLRSPSAVGQIKMANLNAALHSAATETVVLREGSSAIGKSLGELHLRRETGVTIIAVIRDNHTTVNPGAEFTVRENDGLVLLGESEKIEEAAKTLLR